MNEREAERREQLLTALRPARAHLRYVADEIDCLGIMLRAGGITIRDAIGWLDGLGAAPLVAEMLLQNMAADHLVADEPATTDDASATEAGVEEKIVSQEAVL